MEMLENVNFLFQIELFLRIIIASILGGIIGYERKNRDKSAGMRTHAIVCLGAALIMIVSKYCFTDIPEYDASRVAAQIVSGVGFLGTGMIFVKHNTVSGLTTAAGVWTTAGIGMAIGSGAYLVGISAAFLVIAVQIILHKISFTFPDREKDNIEIITNEYQSVIIDIQKQLEAEDIKVLNYRMNKDEFKTQICFAAVFQSVDAKNNFLIRWSNDSRILQISG